MTDADGDPANEFLDLPAPVSYLPDFDGVDTSGWPRFDWSRVVEVYQEVIHGNERQRRQVAGGKDLEWINKSSSGWFFYENYNRMVKIIENEFYEFTPDTGKKIQQSYANYMSAAFANGLFVAFYEGAEGYEIIYPDSHEPHELCHSGIEFRPWMLEAGRGKSWYRDCDKTWFLMAGDLPSGLLVEAVGLSDHEPSRSSSGGPLSDDDRNREAEARKALERVCSDNAGMKGVKADAFAWLESRFGVKGRAARRVWDNANLPSWKTGGSRSPDKRINFKEIN